MKRIALPRLLTLCGAALLAGPALAEETSRYETGGPAISRIASDLYQALKPEHKQRLRQQPVILEGVHVPYAQPGEHEEGSVPTVCLSAGFVDLMTYLAHAKAIDEVEKGYFKKYLGILAAETGEKALSGLPNVSDPKCWSFDTMNHQVSYFNQMVGSLIAVNQAHHYLGHYQKYAGQAATPTTPLAARLSAEEWREAVLKGARHALDCGLGVDGLKMFYESLDKMQNRPAWAAYFLPANANVGKLKRELDRVERDFFLAGK